MCKLIPLHFWSQVCRSATDFRCQRRLRQYHRTPPWWRRRRDTPRLRSCNTLPLTTRRMASTFPPISKVSCKTISPFTRESWVGRRDLSSLKFLDAFSHLNKRVCPSVGPSVGRSVGPSVRHTRVEFLINEVDGLKQNGIKNMKLYQIIQKQTRQIARTHLMSKLCQTCFILSFISFLPLFHFIRFLSA